MEVEITLSTNSASTAREVLIRCEYLFSEMRSENFKRISWQAKFSGTVALLRSGGHALDKSDSKTSVTLSRAIEQWWEKIKANKPAPEIFWLFIEDERNLILKEERLRTNENLTITLAPAILRWGRGKKSPPIEMPPPRYNYEMNGGPFTGRDPHDLVEEAIQWWRKELDSIEQAANSDH